MPSSLKSIYAVLTFQHMLNVDQKQASDYTIQWLMTLFPVERALIISEMGVNENNFHLNVCVYTNNPKRSDTLRQSIYSHVYKKLNANYVPTKYDVKVKAMVDEGTLIGGYLQKEEKYSVVYNSGYDLSKMKNECKTVVKPNYKNQIVVTTNSVDDLMIKYAESNNMDLYTREDFKKVYISMSKNGYTFANVNGKIRYIFASIMGKMTGKDDYMEIVIDALLDKPI